MKYPTVLYFEEAAAAVRRWFMLLCVVAVPVGAWLWLRHHDADVRRQARFTFVADSLQRVQGAYQRHAEMQRAAADSAIAVADSLHALVGDAPTVITRLVAATPLPRPSIIGDTIVLGVPPVPYVVPHPVALWAVAASEHIAHLEAAIRDTIQPAFDALLGETTALRAANRELQSANLNLDSLAAARMAELKLTRSELDRVKPSRWLIVRRVGEAAVLFVLGRLTK